MFGRTKPSLPAATDSLAIGCAPEALPGERLPDLASLWEPPTGLAQPTVESVLLSRGQITAEQLEQARQLVRQEPGKSMPQTLAAMGAASDAQVQSALAQTLGLAFEQPAPDGVDAAAFGLLPADYLRRHLLVPLRFEGDRVVIAAADPTNIFLLDDVRKRCGRAVDCVMSTRADIERLIEQMSAAAAGAQVSQIIRDVTAADDHPARQSAAAEASELEQLGSESPIIRFVNHVIAEAIGQNASDIHIEPKEKSLQIRYRIDGVLFEAVSPPAAMQAAIVSRLKIMANLDISERRLPQDGRIRTAIQGRMVDLRLSTLPTTHGEKCVLRILDTRTINVSLDDLGFSDDAMTIWQRQIAQPHGILLVTGPTGSGKTTTLYASLRSMDARRLNISTVEDPVEYHLESATQVQVHEKIGMTFAAVLRSLLRQDPDVVMVGEIRDGDTAAIAVQAALTGHLVLSTLHTNDAPSSVTRLINCGVEPYLISSAVNAILAQRLVRRICPHCREPYQATAEMQEFLLMQGFSLEQCFRGRGCERCRMTGYGGRVGIYELLVMDDALRDMVTANPDVNQLRKLCQERGLVTLREDGFQKVMKGLTTVDEILRVTANGA